MTCKNLILCFFIYIYIYDIYLISDLFWWNILVNWCKWLNKVNGFKKILVNILEISVHICNLQYVYKTIYMTNISYYINIIDYFIIHIDIYIYMFVIPNQLVINLLFFLN